MREIKFRAWDKKEKKMYEVYAIDWSHGVIVTAHLYDGEISRKTYPNEHYGDRIEFMQFTGLKDKNGKEIYEGDIIEFEFNGKKERTYIKMHDENGDGYCWWMSLPMGKREFEVIGNIYENGDLLK